MRSGARLILATAFVVLLFNAGVRFSIGLVLKPMADDLGWTRSAISLSVTVFMILTAVSLPFVGGLVDRFGVAKVLSISVVTMAAGTAAMSLVQTPLHALVCYGVVVAAGSAGTSITPIGVLLSRWFPDRMGLANSIAISGMGVGQLVVILALAHALTDIGWRGAFVALGLASVVCVLPMVWLAARQRPPAPAPGAPSDAAEGQTGDRASPAPGGTGSLRDIARSRYLWWLLAMYAICGFHDFFMATHVVAFALDEGLSETLSGNMLAFMGLAGLAGVLATGVAAERFGPMAPTIACFVLRIVLFAAVLGTREPAALVAIAIAYGATFWITAPLTVVFVKLRYGTALLGTTAGIVTMVHHAAGGIGAIAGGTIFDATGSYDAAYLIALLASVAALGCIRMMAVHSRQRRPSENTP